MEPAGVEIAARAAEFITNIREVQNTTANKRLCLIFLAAAIDVANEDRGSPAQPATQGTRSCHYLQPRKQHQWHNLQF